MPNGRNLFGRFQDVVAGPQGQQSNLQLLGALLKSLGTLPQREPLIQGGGTRVPSYVGPTLPEQLGAATRGTVADIGAGLGQAGRGVGQFFAPPAQAIGRFATGVAGVPNVPPTTGIAQAAPAPTPGILPQGAPTGAGLPTQQPPGMAPTGPTGAKKGITDQQRQLLGLALQVGLPLALAGFGGQRGLAAGAGLAKGFSAAATARAEREEKLEERELKQTQQDIENRLKLVEEVRKQGEAQRKEIEARLKATKGAKKFPGVKKTVEERLKSTEGLFRPGERIAERVTKAKERALTKPKKVAQEDWDAATEVQRRDLLEALR